MEDSYRNAHASRVHKRKWAGGRGGREERKYPQPTIVVLYHRAATNAREF
jgi:hypothetical protein